MGQVYDFAKSSEKVVEGHLNLIGIGYDKTACFRKGAACGPRAVREASPGIESYSPYLGKDTERLRSFYDVGDIKALDQENVEECWKKTTGEFQEKLGSVDLQKTPLLTMGGEHSISYVPIVEYLDTFDTLALIHLDAHADLRDGYQGFKFSHASIIRRVLDHFGEGHTLIQYGIRSGTEEEYTLMRERGSLRESLDDFLESISELPADRPIYLTLDLDYFDPAYMPGTGTPEPGGEDFHSFAKLIKILQNKRLVGADVVELAPDIDPTGNSSVFAAKVVRELIILLNTRG